MVEEEAGARAPGLPQGQPGSPVAQICSHTIHRPLAILTGCPRVSPFGQTTLEIVAATKVDSDYYVPDTFCRLSPKFLPQNNPKIELLLSPLGR